MKAEELRIGNIVLDDNSDLCIIKAIDSEREFTYKGELFVGSTVVHNKKYNGTLGKWVQQLQPIPLSEEVLLKCPEIKPSSWMSEMWTIRDPKSQFHIVKMKGRFVFRGLGMSVVYVDTLHHLQNLVYTVTGEELEVSL